jgi:hypothetical protein
MRRERRADPPWTPFVEATHILGPDGEPVPLPPNGRFFLNSRYQVELRLVAPAAPFGRILWLSIRRLDRAAVHDWRDLQRIKTELVGPECEAVELYPAESRHHDTANQYHLWCMIDRYRFPFGYAERLLMERPDLAPGAERARQRPWRPDDRPADVVPPEQIRERGAADGRLVAPLVSPTGDLTRGR